LQFLFRAKIEELPVFPRSAVAAARAAPGTPWPRPGVYVDLLRITVERQAALDHLVEELKRAGT